MLELSEIARSAPLQGFISDPPQYLSPRNGVLGVALSYDAVLVDEVARRIRREDRTTQSRSIEFSTSVALGLVRVADDKSKDYELWAWWRDVAMRRFGRYVEPIVIEVTVSPEFPKSASVNSRNFDFFENYRIVKRRSRGATLHYAEGGGRFFPQSYPHKASWGTLGGFLEVWDNQMLYAVTAAHVADDGLAFGTPASLIGDSWGLRPMRNILGRMSAFPVWERGVISQASQADKIPNWSCHTHAANTTVGLDVALAKWQNNKSAKRKKVDAVSRAQLSQVIPIRFKGASSGLQEVYISSYSIWHSYKDKKRNCTVCLSDCFEIRLPFSPFVREDVSRSGDSGAWVIADGIERPQWIGLLVGGDGARSGIVPADRIVKHFDPLIGSFQPLI